MAAEDSVNYGFDRPEMFSLSLANTVDSYDRHVFLCYKNPESWPSSVENSDADPLPKLLASALKARKDDIPLKVSNTYYLLTCVFRVVVTVYAARRLMMVFDLFGFF